MKMIIGLASIVWMTCTLGAQTSVDVPPFEVASIKPADPSAQPGRFAALTINRINTNLGVLSSRSASLKDLIVAAYEIEAYQVSGGPAWLDSARFEVQARSAQPANREELLLMLRLLLKDRFKLVSHRETKQLSVCALTAGKNRPNLQPSKSGEESKPAAINRLGRGWDMAMLARYLTTLGSDRPVIDRTGLTGTFELDLDLPKIVGAASGITGGPATNGGPPSNENIFQATVDAIEAQLRLRLTATRAAIDVLVIDAVEPPSAN